MIKAIIIGCNDIGRRVYENLIQVGDFELLAMVTHNTEKALEFIKGYPVIHFKNEERIWTRSGAHVAIFCGRLEDDLVVDGEVCTQWLNMVDCCNYLSSTDPDIALMRERIMFSARRTLHTVITSIVWGSDMFAPLRDFEKNLNIAIRVEGYDPITLTAQALIAYARACVAMNNRGMFGLIHPREVAPIFLNYRSEDYEHK